MIPKIAARGHSFKGAINYLMHDKGRAETSERVAWHATGNMRTDDPMLAAKVMAYTDANREELKAQAEISEQGRKSRAGAVFHYLLSWEQGSQPEQEHMRDCVNQTLQRLGLADHEHVMVAHNDTDKPHVHVIANLTNPEDGTRNSLKYSKRNLQEWALEYEREHGLHCHAREENAQNRARGVHEKYQDTKRDYGEAVTAAFQQSDNGQAFIQALREQGLSLAVGDKGKFVVVDERGNTDALTRNLNIDARGRAKTEAIQNKFADIDRDTLLQANDLATARQEAQAAEEQRNSPETVIEKMQQHHAAFTRQQLERELYRRFPDDTERRQLIDRVLQHDSLLAIGEKNGNKVYATQQMVDLERGFIKTAASMQQRQTHGIDEQHRAAAVEKFNAALAEKLQDDKAAITEQQQAAIDHITRSNQLSNLVGIAGAGKSTILSVAKDTWEAQGYRVRGAALSGIAAQGLKDNGIEAGTLHSLEGRARVAQEIMQQQGRPLTPKQAELVQDATLTQQDVLIIDEAGMVSTPQMKRVMDMAQQSGTKIVLVGDQEQLQSIEAGAAFRTVLERTEAAELDEVRRQQEEWQKAATVDMAKGETIKGLQAYDAQGCVHHERDRATAKHRLISDMMQSYDDNADKSRMVLAYTRADVNDLNQKIRQQMIERGHVQQHGTDANILVEDGDETHRVQERFSIGDRLMFRQNSKDLGVMNGSLGTVYDIENSLFSVTLDNGQQVNFDATEYQKFQLGYAATVHKSQGVTVDETYVLGSRHFDRHAAYVAMSRHTETAQLYTGQDDFRSRESVFKAMSKDGANLSTLDFAEQAPVTTHQPKEKVKEQDNIMRKDQSLVPEEIIIGDTYLGQPTYAGMSSKEKWEAMPSSRSGQRTTPEEHAQEQEAAYDQEILSPTRPPLQQQFAHNRAIILDHLQHDPDSHSEEYADYRERQQALLESASPEELWATGLTTENIELEGFEYLETAYREQQASLLEPETVPEQDQYELPEPEQSFNNTANDTYDDIRERLDEAKANYQPSEPVIDQELPRADGGTVKIYDTSERDRIAALQSTLDTRQLSPENAQREVLQKTIERAQAVDEELAELNATPEIEYDDFYINDQDTGLSEEDYTSQNETYWQAFEHAETSNDSYDTGAEMSEQSNEQDYSY